MDSIFLLVTGQGRIISNSFGPMVFYTREQAEAKLRTVIRDARIIDYAGTKIVEYVPIIYGATEGIE